MPGSYAGGIFQVPQIARLPRHLKRFIVEQNYDEYTPVDQAVWRAIMRQAVPFHQRHAHQAYVDGLRQTGITLERIPRIEEMNEILGRIGWGAAPVDGFIPPAAFMEFQAHRLLVIAAGIRQIDHLEYTPAPDIVHEAAGHAPIIADREYAEYLRRFGEVGSKALSSRQDLELYEAIRHLSIVKEAPGTPPGEIEAAERRVSDKQASLGTPSEMALLSRLHWWTVEYGLIGTLQDPKLYGAGLLSSIGEAATCLTDVVKKLPYGVEAAEFAFDITKMQPQLFVTPSFEHLSEVLESFAATLAFRRGGLEGLRRSMGAGLVTFAYSSGLQVSGTVAEVEDDGEGHPIYVKTCGPTALAASSIEFKDHGRIRHPDGFGAVVGRPRGLEQPLELLDDGALKRQGLEPGKEALLEFAGGIRLRGRLERSLRREGKLLLLTFSNCRVERGDRVLFDPAWGEYDMAVGEKIISVFQGAADVEAFEEIDLVPRERTAKVNVEEKTRPLHELFRRVREIRESGQGEEELPELYARARRQFPEAWLLALEILEILEGGGRLPDLRSEIRQNLEQAAREDETSGRLIRNGLAGC